MERAKRSNSAIQDAKDQKTPKYLQVSQPVNIVITLLFLVLALACIIPAIFVLIISMTSEQSIYMQGYSFIPLEWSFESYSYLWDQKGSIGSAFLVSIFVTVCGTVLGLFTNTTLGYVLSRPSFKLKKFYTFFILIPMLIGGGMVASYLVNTRLLGFKNNILALIIPLSTSTFYTIILRTFFQTTVPDEIIESAKIDGASQLRIFLGIVLPISLPAIATIGLFLSFNYWNDWFTALLYIDSNHYNLYPLQYVLHTIQERIDFLVNNPDAMIAVDPRTIPSQSIRMAIVMVIVLPIACAYPFFQRYFVSGLTIGAVKG